MGKTPILVIESSHRYLGFQIISLDLEVVDLAERRIRFHQSINFMTSGMLFANNYQVRPWFVLREFLLVFLTHFDSVNLSWLMSLTRQSRMWLCCKCFLSFGHLARLWWIYFVALIDH